MSSLGYNNAAEIRQRIEEIGRLQAAHDSRDMDAELLDVMMNGGSIDAMEAAQIEAERVSRRLRVELAALERALHGAVRQEAEEQIADLHARHRSLAQDASKEAETLCSAWKTFNDAIERWEAVQKAAEEITRRAQGLSISSGAEAPKMGNFRSAKVAALSKATIDLHYRFKSADREMHVGAGARVLSTVID